MAVDFQITHYFIGFQEDSIVQESDLFPFGAYFRTKTNSSLRTASFNSLKINYL